MSWKYVYNTRAMPGDDFEDVKRLVAKTNYQFFIFNGSVWMLMKVGEQVFTELTYISTDELF